MPLNELAEAVAASADALHDPERLEETLGAILASAVRAMDSFDHAGLLISVKGHIAGRASTDELAEKLDRTQAEIGEGPALAVIGGSQTLVVPDLRHEQRWPRYVPTAAGLGATAQVSARLQFDHTATLGSLNLYASGEPVIDADTESLAEVFGAQAAVAIGGASVVADLTAAMASRKVIGQALGILMERYGLDETHAFAFLRRESSHRNVKLRELARELVNSVGRPAEQTLEH